jgi:hypothetical protein
MPLTPEQHTSDGGGTDVARAAQVCRHNRNLPGPMENLAKDSSRAGKLGGGIPRERIYKWCPPGGPNRAWTFAIEGLAFAA